VGVTGHFRVYMERIFANIFVSIRIVGLSDQWRDTGILSYLPMPIPSNSRVTIPISIFITVA